MARDELMLLPPSAIKPPRSKKHGHAALPGSGPTGQTCGSCAHLHRKTMASTYLKCRLMQAYWTGGGATDVRAKDATCRRWVALESHGETDAR